VTRGRAQPRKQAHQASTQGAPERQDQARLFGSQPLHRLGQRGSGRAHGAGAVVMQRQHVLSALVTAEAWGVRAWGVLEGALW